VGIPPLALFVNEVFDFLGGQLGHAHPPWSRARD
jgi:hypothetical protein